jgi:3-oxoacyl-[acyl-carrier protein] reductase
MPTSAASLTLAPKPGSRVLIAGGCGGIGRALVDECLRGQLRVAVVDLAASIAAHPVPATVAAFPCDAADETSVQTAMSQVQHALGGLDAFVNLCGFRVAPLTIDAMPTELWDEAVRGNLRGAFVLSKHALPLLRQGSAPSMVHVTSGLGSYGGVGYGPYSVSKGGMNTLVRALARENAPWLRVNAVAPGYVDTAFSRGGTGRSDEAQPLAFDVAAYERAVPLGRVAAPADIVGPILFLLGSAAAFLTGQVLHVNGGAYLP